MADAFIVRRGAATPLNYKVVYSATQPSSPKENTIWVNTQINAEEISELYTTRLSTYINATSGKVTTPSSNTCYTRFFKCTAGRKYRFRLSDGQTVLVAGFTAKPASGVVGTVLAGEGKTTGADSFDYTLTAASGTQYLAIWYYDSSANTGGVPHLRVTDVTLQESLPAAVTATDHCFSATEPESPQNGLVWFQTGVASQASFNVMKKDGAMLYPRSCAWYYNGDWIPCQAKSYIGGQWIDWSLYLFANGTENIEVTGGFTGSGASGAYKTEDGELFFYVSSGSSGACRTVKPIDLRGYKKLCFEVSKMNASICYVALSATTGTAVSDFVSHTTSSEQSGSFSVDISKLSELSTAHDFYLLVRLSGGSTSKGVRISEMHLE